MLNKLRRIFSRADSAIQDQSSLHSARTVTSPHRQIAVEDLLEADGLDFWIEDQAIDPYDHGIQPIRQSR